VATSSSSSIEDADIFETLRMRLDELPTEPLTQGRRR
jgi:hypothetical protein